MDAISAASPAISRADRRDQAELPITTHIDIRGQKPVMNEVVQEPCLGLILAVILVYALRSCYSSPWVDPFIIMMAVPGALIGILWMLAVTHTTINVESLMGASQSVGFRYRTRSSGSALPDELRTRRDISASGGDRGRKHAAAAGPHDRARHDHRMIPMALSLGEPGEQMRRSAAPSSAASSPPRSPRSHRAGRLHAAAAPAAQSDLLDERFAAEARGEAPAGSPMSDQRRPGGGAVYVIGLILVVAMGALASISGTRSRPASRRPRRSSCRDRARPRVEVIAAEAGPRMRRLTLLGDAKPSRAVTLYAKIVGYLKVMAVDKGTGEAGQVIAEIDSAETDHQYSSAVAISTQAAPGGARERAGRRQITSPKRPRPRDQ